MACKAGIVCNEIINSKIYSIRLKSGYSIYLHKDISIQLVKQTVFEKKDRQRLLWQGIFIICNLLSNAIKFSQRNSTVKVNAFCKHGFLTIEIIDDGIGMSENRIKKLLKKNTTITRRGTEKEKGTGLGLLISKEFIE